VFNLEVFVTAHTEKERLEWEEKFLDKILRLVDGVSVYDGHGCYRTDDGVIVHEPHSHIVVYGMDSNEIHRLYAWIYPLLLEYLHYADQEAVLVLMNGNMSLIRLPVQEEAA